MTEPQIAATDHDAGQSSPPGDVVAHLRMIAGTVSGIADVIQLRKPADPPEPDRHREITYCLIQERWWRGKLVTRPAVHVLVQGLDYGHGFTIQQQSNSSDNSVLILPDHEYGVLARVPEFFHALGQAETFSVEQVRELLDQLGARDTTGSVR